MGSNKLSTSATVRMKPPSQSPKEGSGRDKAWAAPPPAAAASSPLAVTSVKKKSQGCVLGTNASIPSYSKYVANPSASQSSPQRSMEAKSPNHWCAISCDTTLLIARSCTTASGRTNADRFVLEENADGDDDGDRDDDGDDAEEGEEETERFINALNDGEMRSFKADNGMSYKDKFWLAAYVEGTNSAFSRNVMRPQFSIPPAAKSGTPTKSSLGRGNGDAVKAAMRCSAEHPAAQAEASRGRLAGELQTLNATCCVYFPLVVVVVLVLVLPS
mmetsp:Transcript_24673/g.44400  ORF Transcript_24673/g.44400 Transcript_24673/m.44400 type:complete len:273 (+) Transcript_24673:1359-2177(+)